MTLKRIFLMAFVLITLASVANAASFADLYMNFSSVSGRYIDCDTNNQIQAWTNRSGGYPVAVMRSDLRVGPQKATFLTGGDNAHYNWLNGTQWYCVDLTATQGGSLWHLWLNTDDTLDDDLDKPMYSTRKRGTIPGVQRAAWLMDQFGGHVAKSTGTAVQGAALQLAVWEALYDNGPSADFGTGDFKVAGWTSGSHGQALALASQWFNYSDGHGAVGFYGDDNQNMERPIPEPTTILLLGVALVGCGTLALRRRPR